MPRKSLKVRLAQTTHLAGVWSESVFANDYRHRFIRDMAHRLERGKGLSAKQRNWLDQLIEEGVPEFENADPALTARCDAAAAAFEAAGTAYEWELTVVKDFRNRVMLGKKMSEKQTSFLNNLLSTGEELAGGASWVPSEEEVTELKNAVRLYHGYSTMWKNDRPGVHRALVATKTFLEEGGHLKRGDADKLCKAVAGKLKKISKPRFKSGDLGKRVVSKWNPVTRRQEVQETQRLVCMSDVYITNDGLIVNDWLLPTGELATLAAERVAKR